MVTFSAFTMDRPSELLLAEVLPELARRIRQLAWNLRNEGIYIRVVQGLRTIAYQDALYARGRTEPGKIVTNARGGQSYHNYGLAVDCVPSINGLTMNYLPDWNPKHPAWQRMETEGKALGLETGAFWRTFPDYPHFQLNGPWPVGKPPTYVRYLVVNGNLNPVWQRITDHIGGTSGNA